VRYVRPLVVLIAALAAVLPVPARAIERVYSQGVYPLLQPAVTSVSSLTSIALFDVSVAALLAFVGALFVHRWRARGFARAAGRTLVTIGTLAAVVYLWFLLLWGLNYRRVPLEERLAYDAARVTRERAGFLAREAVRRANALAADDAAAHLDEEALARSLRDVQHALGSGARLRVAPPKRSLLGWYFRQAAIDGMTNPFFLEIVLNPDLLPFERPFVLAHEWAHLAGFADESEANFIAWLTCIRADAAARYSGWTTAYQHLSSQLPREERQALRAELSPAVLADLVAASRRVARASPAVRMVARDAYDTYLRANRVEEGIASYNAVVRLMVGTAFDAEWQPELRR